MNFTNKMLCITVLFVIGSVSARAPKTRAGAGSITTPAPTQPTAPALPARSYKQLHDNILNMSQGAVFTGNKLNDTFIQNTVAQVKATDLGADGLKFLLQTARDKFAPFTGNNDQDFIMLQEINAQIDNATL